jgi:hypothetical protein
MAIHRACAAHAQQAQAPQGAAAPRTEYHFAFTPDEVNLLADILNSAHQVNHLAAELRRVGCSCLAHRGLLEPK